MYIDNEFGYCAYAIEEDYAHIYDLFVYPEFRRKGKATELLQSAINEIRRLGWEDVIKIVAIPIDNSISKEKLVAFYKSMNLDVYEYYA